MGWVGLGVSSLVQSVYMHMSGRVGAAAFVLRWEYDLCESALSFHHVGSRDPTWFSRLDVVFSH